MKKVEITKGRFKVVFRDKDRTHFFETLNGIKSLKRSERTFDSKLKCWYVSINQDNVTKLQDLGFSIPNLFTDDEDYSDVELTLIVKGKTVSVVGLNDYLRGELKRQFTFIDTSECHTAYGYNAAKARKVKLFYEKPNKLVFYLGFLDEIDEILRTIGIEYKFKTDRIKKEKAMLPFLKEDFRKYFNPNFKYIEHQIRITFDLLNKHCGIAKVPTGGGKTEIFIAMLKVLRRKSLIIVDSVSLADQTKDRMLKAGINTGCFHGKEKTTDTDIIIVTFQSLDKLNETVDLSKYVVCICDECHIAANATIQNFLAVSEFQRYYGFSATPDARSDYENALIRQYLGQIVGEVPAEELMNNAVIVRPKIYFHTIEQEEFEIWPDSEEFCIIKNEVRNRKIADLSQQESTLILYKRIEHGIILNKLIPGSEMLSGEDSRERRKDVVNRFKKKEVKVLLASNIFKQGISINEIRVLILVGGGKSKIDTLQKLGRGVRNDEGKDILIVHEFYDEGNKYTERHSIQRIKTYKDEGYTDIEIL
jgi:superfamily II DNA or RNA helicase